MSVCLDSFALLSWFQNETAASLVEKHLAAAAADEATHCYASNINFGEVFYRIARTRGSALAESFWTGVGRPAFPVTPVAVTRGRIREATLLKARHPIASPTPSRCSSPSRNSSRWSPGTRRSVGSGARSPSSWSGFPAGSDPLSPRGTARGSRRELAGSRSRR